MAANNPQQLVGSRTLRTSHRKSRSALGIGVTTLVTILVVLLLAAFAILSLASARSDHALSQTAVRTAEAYYAADSEASSWYAELDARAAALKGDPAEYAAQLSAAGYDTNAAGGELRVTKAFTISDNRSLVVTIAVNDDKTTTIRQWQS
jgi:hypothetical protein